MTDPHLCKFCGTPIKMEDPQSFCSMCGANLKENFSLSKESKSLVKEIAPEGDSLEDNASIDTELDDSSEGEPKISFLDKVKYSYFDSIYRLNFNYSKKTDDLIRSRLLLTSNLRLIHKHPIVYSDDRVSILTNEMRLVSSQIKHMSQEIKNDIDKLETLFKSQKFDEAKENLKPLYLKISQNGLVYLLNPYYLLKLKIKKNISLIRSLRRFGEKISDDISESDLERKFFTIDHQLNKLKIKQALSNKHFLIHPEILEKMVAIKSQFEEYIQEKQIKLPELNVSKKISIWIGNTKELLNIQNQNFKFKRLCAAAKKWKDLPAAWKKIQEAEKILEQFPDFIFFNSIDKFRVIKEQVESLIEELNNETKIQLLYVQELMADFRFVESDSLMKLLVEKYEQYSMSVLIEQIRVEQNVCNINMELYNRLLDIEAIFQTADYLSSQKSMRQLIEKIESKVKPEILLDNIKERVDKFSLEINKCRDEGEEILRSELVAIKTKLMAELNFEEVNTLLQQKHIIATQQEYHSYLDQHKHFLKEFNQNFDVFQQVLQFEDQLAHEKFGSILQGKIKISNMLEKSDILIYSNLEDKFKKLEKDLEQKIVQEESKFQEKVDQINALLDESIDIDQSTSILQEIIARNNFTGLEQFQDRIERLSQKVKLNSEGLDEIHKVQLIFSEGDIKDAFKQCKKLLDKIDSGLKTNPKIYSSSLRENVANLHGQIEIGLQDGVEKLESDYKAILAKLKKSLEFTEIIDLLSNYEIRAQRLGLNTLKQELHVLNLQCQHNLSVVSKCKKLERNYDSITEFPQTLKSIQEIMNVSADDKQLFEQVQIVLKTLDKKVKQGNSEREGRMNDSLETIIKKEINVLHFNDARNSLEQLLETAKGLVVKSIIPEINKYIELTTNHQQLLESVEEAKGFIEIDKVIEARNMMDGLQTAISQYKGIIINPMRDYIAATGSQIQNQIDTEISTLKSSISKIVEIIEEKQAESIYDELLECKEKAIYLEIGDTVEEIDDLIKLCHLQFDPTEKDKNQKKKKEKQKLTEVKTTFVKADDISEEITGDSLNTATSITFMVPAVEEDEAEILPEFKTMKEKREYKRKIIKRKRARIHKPPVVKQNLNNQARSSLVRQQLQRYSQQINRPVKRTNIDRCESCGAKQPTNEEKFCFFCGKTI
ncbi:hypothetical protein NEF87_001226 [Candidatus Lokiarchaeum ossiferum]|uniref:Zinc-ribbon domain-containing protein n=1 Tax=Candidatus Lokiarchaeum ossiferum TaxID=2951803 RepID=A0ABY6HQV3_9ARCH|nr:hypothetical protein NEF87_001226 [Candidatus Lokiarchaeum sp. B-35]